MQYLPQENNFLSNDIVGYEEFLRTEKIKEQENQYSLKN